MSLSNDKIQIIFSAGAFGNHLRWVLLLSFLPKIKIPQIHWNKEVYNDIKGPDWPSDFCDWQDLPEWIQEECKYHIGGSTGANGLTVDFVLDFIYPENRTWHNWLWYEWRYRTYLNKILPIAHFVPGIEINLNVTQNIGITIDPDLAYCTYVKFNSSLNNMTKEGFKELTIASNNYINNNRHKMIKIVDASLLFDELLNQKMYEELVRLLNLPSCYHEAKVIHQRWYQLHKQAEQDLLQELTDLYIDNKQ